jgi:hypothetical protein
LKRFIVLGYCKRVLQIGFGRSVFAVEYAFFVCEPFAVVVGE